jgi:hypothetical protein
MTKDGPFHTRAKAVARKPGIWRRVIEGISLNPESMKMLFLEKLVLSCQEFWNPRRGNYFAGP